jgi:hypothetical protein
MGDKGGRDRCGRKGKRRRRKSLSVSPSSPLLSLARPVEERKQEFWTPPAPEAREPSFFLSVAPSSEESLRKGLRKKRRRGGTERREGREGESSQHPWPAVAKRKAASAETPMAATQPWSSRSTPDQPVSAIFIPLLSTDRWKSWGNFYPPHPLRSAQRRETLNHAAAAAQEGKKWN